MGRINDLCVVVFELVEQCFLDMCVNVSFRLFDKQKVGDRLFSLLILEFKQFQREEYQVCSTKAQLVDRSFVALPDSPTNSLSDWNNLSASSGRSDLIEREDGEYASPAASLMVSLISVRTTCTSGNASMESFNAFTRR